MNSRNDDRKAYRKYLFHGTDCETIEKIRRNGFNRSFSCRSAYGQGVYFAVDAEYSINPRYAVPDAQGVQRVLLCSVLTGHCQLGNSNMRRPDENGETGLPFDSMVDSLENPKIYVSAHNDNQAYAAYLIEFNNEQYNFPGNPGQPGPALPARLQNGPALPARLQNRGAFHFNLLSEADKDLLRASLFAFVAALALLKYWFYS